MSIMDGAVRVVTRTAEVTTAAAGAVGGAAVNGLIGGVHGTAVGIKNGLGSGSHSAPAAALTLAAIGATGLVEWPILLGAGGTVLLIRQLNRRSSGQAATTPTLSAVPDRRSAPRKAPAAKRSPRTATKATKSAARSSAGRSRRSPAKR